MDSSLIAGLQPTGVATPLLTAVGGTSAASNAAALNLKMTPGGTGGLFGDGFRERFEASVGTFQPDSTFAGKATVGAIQDSGSDAALPRSGAILAGSDASIAQVPAGSPVGQGQEGLDGAKQGSPRSGWTAGLDATVETKPAEAVLLPPDTQVRAATETKTLVREKVQQDSPSTPVRGAQIELTEGQASNSPRSPSTSLSTLLSPLQLAAAGQSPCVVESGSSEVTGQTDPGKENQAAQSPLSTPSFSLLSSRNRAPTGTAASVPIAAKTTVVATVRGTSSTKLAKTTSSKAVAAEPVAATRKDALLQVGLNPTASSARNGQTVLATSLQAQLSPAPVSAPQVSPAPALQETSPETPLAATQPALKVREVASVSPVERQLAGRTASDLRTEAPGLIPAQGSNGKSAESQVTRGIDAGSSTIPFVAALPTPENPGVLLNQAVSTPPPAAALPTPPSIDQPGTTLSSANGLTTSNKGASLPATLAPAVTSVVPAAGKQQISLSIRPAPVTSTPQLEAETFKSFDLPHANQQAKDVAGNNDPGTSPLQSLVRPAGLSLKAEQKADATVQASPISEANTPTPGVGEIGRQGPLAPPGTDQISATSTPMRATVPTAVETVTPGFSQRRVASVKGLDTIPPAAATARPQQPISTAPASGTPGLTSAIGNGDPSPSSKVAPEASSLVKERPLQAQGDPAQTITTLAVSHPSQAEFRSEAKIPAGLQQQTILARTSEAIGNGGAVEGLDHTTLVSTPNVLEVGVASGTNGWLKVRAEMDGTGGVAASVMTTTVGAADALHKELPSLSAYLRDESVGVSSLVVHRAEGGGVMQDATASFGAGSSGAGAESGRGRPSNAGDGPVSQQLPSDGADQSAPGIRSGDPSGLGATTRYGASSGGWLNVVA